MTSFIQELLSNPFAVFAFIFGLFIDLVIFTRHYWRKPEND